MDALNKANKEPIRSTLPKNYEQYTWWQRHGILVLIIIFVSIGMLVFHFEIIQPQINDYPRAMHLIKTVDCKTLLSEELNYTSQVKTNGGISNGIEQFWETQMANEYKNRCTT